MSIFLLFSLFLLLVSASGSAYNRDSIPNLPNPEKPNINITNNDMLLPSICGVQGIIYCKSGPKLIPLEGAKARLTCLAVDQNGYESAPFSVLSCPADKKGYFFATFLNSELEETWKLTECKAFLENSPLEECNVPSDFNKGLSGALLSSYKLLKSMKLYTVGPFVYTNSVPKSAPTGY